MAFTLSGHTNSYHSYDFEDALRGIAAAGFRTIELTAVTGWTEHVPLKPTDAQVREVQAKLDHHGLTPTVLSGHSDLTTPEGLELGRDAARLCHDLGIGTLVTAIGGHYKEGEDKAAFMAQIHALADECESLGLTIGLEVHGEIMATGAKSVALIEEIGRDNVRITYDTANCELYGGVEAANDIEQTIPYLCHVHLKDKAGAQDEWNFPAVGEGRVDFARILELLRSGGYDGALSTEIEFQGEPWPDLAEVDRSMRVSRETLRSLGAG